MQGRAMKPDVLHHKAVRDLLEHGVIVVIEPFCCWQAEIVVEFVGGEKRFSMRAGSPRI